MSRAADPTTKIALLRAAEAVFAERGVEGAKVEDIAKVAHVSKGAFYLHFESKEVILKQVVESFLGRMSAQFTVSMDQVPEGPDALLAFWSKRDEESFEFLWQSRPILAILQACIGEHHYLLDAFRAECRASVVQWILLLKDRGLVRKELHAEAAAAVLNGAYNELVLQLLSRKTHPDFLEWLGAAREIFVRGLGMPRLISALERQKRGPRNPRVSHGIEFGARDPMKRNGARRQRQRVEEVVR